MRVCVDTSILIDVLKDEFREYQELFYTALFSGIKKLHAQPSQIGLSK
jgi:hypothetical protein